jgi:hypothetical protein
MEVEGKTAEEILKSKAKVERARLKRVADREAAKTGPKRPVVKKAKPKTKPKKPKAAKKKVGNGRPLVRTERMDLRLTKQERAKVMARVKKTGNTVTGVIMEAVTKAKW